MTDSSRRGPAPAGHRSLTIYLAVHDAAAAIRFYTTVFGAELLDRFAGPNDTVSHAELRLGDCVLQLGDPMPSMGLVGPPATGNDYTITFWTDDVDGTFARAVAGGATVLSEVDDVFSGDRMGLIRCPFGVRWNISRHDRDVSSEKLHAAADAWMSTADD